MYLNTVFKYNVFKYCPALVRRTKIQHGWKTSYSYTHALLYVYEAKAKKVVHVRGKIASCTTV